MLSAGCEVIRIAKTVLRSYIDNTTMKKIKKKIITYQTDEDLYKVFKWQNNWRCFREELVDDIIEYKHSVGKALKERSVSIPKLPLIQRKCISRAPSPSENWQKLVEDGHVTKSKLHGRILCLKIFVMESIISNIKILILKIL